MIYVVGPTCRYKRAAWLNPVWTMCVCGVYVWVCGGRGWWSSVKTIDYTTAEELVFFCFFHTREENPQWKYCFVGADSHQVSWFRDTPEEMRVSEAGRQQG